MNVSNKSWHYRLYDVYHLEDFKRRPDNLCPYMRGILRGMFFVIASITIGSFVVVLTISPLIAAFMMIVSEPLWLFFDDYHGLYWVLPVLIIIVSSVVFYEHAKDKYRAYKYSRVEKPETKPSPFWLLVKSYYRGAHDKVCPSIKVIKGD